jgi:hypothetical protein
MDNTNKNDGLLGSAIIAGLLVILVHCMVRGVVTAQEPFMLNDVLGAIVGWAMGIVLIAHFAYLLFLRSDEEWRRVASLAVVGAVAVAVAYGVAYGMPVENYVVYMAAFIAFILSAVLITTVSPGTGLVGVEVTGIYILEAIVVFTPLFVFLRTFKM